MSRYINADILREKMMLLQERDGKYLLTHEVFNTIWDTPTADVRENKHGEWLYEQLIPNDITGKMHGECSMCHKVRIVDNYCPNCGTNMQKEVEK